MDSNSISQLVAALKDTLPVHVPAPAVNQNSVLIWTMVISALTPVITAFVVWLTKRSTDTRLDKQSEVLKEVHTEVNSKNAAMVEELKNLRAEVKELTRAKATAEEKQRGQETIAAVTAAQLGARRESEIT